MILGLIPIFLLGVYLARLCSAQETELIQLLKNAKRSQELKENKLLRTQVEEMIEAKKWAIKKDLIAKTMGTATGKGEVVDEEEDAAGTGTEPDVVAPNKVEIDENGIDAQIASELKAYLNERDNEGKTAILWAAEHGSIEAVASLYQYGADIFAKSSRVESGPSAFEIIGEPKNWPENWFQDSKNDHNPFPQLRPVMRLRAMTREASNEIGFLNNMPRVHIAHIAGFFTNHEFLGLRGVSWGGYCQLSDPYVINYAGNQHTNGITDWKAIRNYNPMHHSSNYGKYWITPGRNFQLHATAEEYLKFFLNNKNLQKKLKGLRLVGDYYLLPETLKKLAAFKYIKGLSLFNFSLSSWKYSGSDLYTALSQVMGQMPQLESVSIERTTPESEQALGFILGDAQLQGRLKHLSISYSVYKDFFHQDAIRQSWRILSKFKNLESLFVGLANHDDVNYRAVSLIIQQIGNLHELTMDVHHSDVADHDYGYSELAKAVNANPRLTRLSFDGHAGDAFFHHFGDHIFEENNIQKLVLKNLRRQNGNYLLSFLKKMKKLEYLAMEDNFGLYKSVILKVVETLKSSPSIKYLSFPRNNWMPPENNWISGTSIPDHEWFNSNDEEVIKALTALKKKHPHMKIIFGEEEIRPVVRRCPQCNIL